MNTRTLILASATLSVTILTSSQLQAVTYGDGVVWGTAGGETLYADNSNGTVVYGYGGGDTIWGGSGDDRLIGGRGWDKIFGEDGEDIIAGQNGYDIMSGGSSGREEGDKMWGGSGIDYCYELEGAYDRTWSCEYKTSDTYSF